MQVVQSPTEKEVQFKKALASILLRSEYDILAKQFIDELEKMRDLADKWTPDVIRKLADVMAGESEQAIAARKEIENVIRRREGISHD